MITLARLKKPVARVALAFLPATLTIMLARMDSAPLPELPEAPTRLTLPEISAVQILDVCEGDFRVTGTAETTQERPVLPDGHPSVWVMVPGRITAGVDLSAMRVTREGDRFRVEFPQPEITSAVPDYAGIQWGHHAGFWTTDPDKAVLALRDSIIGYAETSLKAQATASGLIAESAENVRSALLRIADALGIEHIDVSTAHNRTIPIGFQD